TSTFAPSSGLLIAALPPCAATAAPAENRHPVHLRPQSRERPGYGRRTKNTGEHVPVSSRKPVRSGRCVQRDSARGGVPRAGARGRSTAAAQTLRPWLEAGVGRGYAGAAAPEMHLTACGGAIWRCAAGRTVARWAAGPVTVALACWVPAPRRPAWSAAGCAGG